MLVNWAPGTVLAGPVYLDANILVGGLVSSHRLYPSCAQVLGDLLSNGTPIVLSDIAVNEAFWTLAKFAYCDLMKQRYDANWSKVIYKRHFARIFAEHGAKVTAVSGWLRALDAAGHPIDVVRSTKTEWMTLTDNTAAYMKEFGLTTNDAAHLALAGAHAQTFITADRDYRVVGGALAPAGLSVVLLPPPS